MTVPASPSEVPDPPGELPAPGAVANSTPALPSPAPSTPLPNTAPEAELAWKDSSLELLTGVEVTDFSESISGEAFHALFRP
jgi:hypothetical protein